MGEAIASNKQLAWVEFNIGSGSYLTYKMPYFAADHEGCVTELECEIKNFEISNGSAVLLRGDKNKPFLSMDTFKLTGHMHYPSCITTYISGFLRTT